MKKLVLKKILELTTIGKTISNIFIGLMCHRGDFRKTEIKVSNSIRTCLSSSIEEESRTMKRAQTVLHKFSTARLSRPMFIKFHLHKMHVSQ